MTTAPLFLAEGAALTAGSQVELGGAEGRHAAAARRLRVGEALALGDGAGRIADATVQAVGRGTVVCSVYSVREVPPPQPRLTVVQALAKGERGELAVETMTEVGVDAVVPWSAARSVARWDGDRVAKGLARWRATAREAAKQSRRAWLPEVAELASTDQIGRLLAAADLALVLHGSATDRLADMAVPAAGEVVLVVGPEGGVAPEELAAFAEAGAVPVRLGPTVLRTSTAGAVAAAVLSARSPRWA